MDDIKKADLYLELYNGRLKSFYKRRDIEWKVTFGLWTVIIIFTGHGARSVKADFAFAFLYLVFWLLYSFIWSWGLHYANELDRRRAYVYLNKLELLTGFTNQEVVFQKPGRLKVFLNWSPLAQIMGTALFLAASWYVFYASS